MQNKKGISALLLVVLIGAVALIFIITTVIISVDEMESAFVFKQADIVKSMAFSCAEEALRRIQIDNELEMSEYILNFSKGFCTISSTKNVDNIDLSILAKRDNYYHKLNISAEIINGKINILSWNNL